MIIGEALRRLFCKETIDLCIDGDTINRTIQFHYGDHKELVKWINDKDKGNSVKYPLVWYVTAPYKEQPNGYKNVRSKLIIFQSTQIQWLNTKRTIKSYDEIIEPVWNRVKKVLEASPYFQVMGAVNDKYNIKDEPSYGVDTSDIRLSQNDFTRTSKKGTESVALDVVDGRIIELNFRIKTNCI